MKIAKSLYLLFLLLSAGVAADPGAIVKCIQPDGSVVYSNHGCEHGKSQDIVLKPIIPLGQHKLEQTTSSTAATTAESAFAAHLSDVQVSGQGEVIKILADDNDGSRHQKFIIRLSSGKTLLIAHNIDLAPRIDSLTTGDTVQFFGEYVWNEKGGVLHWTHRDPNGTHPAGWLECKGKRYQ